MKTIISASRRTDIPAFYLDWFSQAIRAGKVQVQNPLYKEHRYEVNLLPGQVEWIVFWSRNYQRFLKRREIFADYNLFFHFTILSHQRQLEKTQLPLTRAINQVEKLAGYYGPQRIIWRYDPIVIWQGSSGIHSNYSPGEFDNLCRRMSALDIRRCYFSFVTPYRKFLQRFKQRFPDQQLVGYEQSPAVRQRILSGLIETTAKYQVELYSCCDDNLVNSSIKKGHCISGELLNSLNGKAPVSRAKAPTRRDCGCSKSIDIGDYIQQPCFTGCIYCYGNPVKQRDKETKGQRDKVKEIFESLSIIFSLCLFVPLSLCPF